MGKAAAESVGATEKTIEKTSTISQFGVEFTKDTVWNVAIGTAVAAGQLTIRDALILSTFANLGGTAYELGVAAGAHGFLKARRMVYNNRHPFFLDEEEISSNVGAFEEIARTDVRADLAV